MQKLNAVSLLLRIAAKLLAIKEGDSKRALEETARLELGADIVEALYAEAFCPGAEIARRELEAAMLAEAERLQSEADRLLEELDAIPIRRAGEFLEGEQGR